MNENLYDIVSIAPASSGFGEWQVTGAHTGDPVDIGDLKAEAEGKVYELGKDQLPEGVEDIRGAIQNQPDVVFAVVDDNDEVMYCGANKI